MTAFNENEYRLFWQIVGELRQAVRDEEDQSLIDYHIDELASMFEHTQNAKLKRLSGELLDVLRPDQVRRA